MGEAAIVAIVNIAFKYGPDAAKAVKALFENANPTEADWDAVFAYAHKSYEDYIKGDAPK